MDRGDGQAKDSRRSNLQWRKPDAPTSKPTAAMSCGTNNSSRYITGKCWKLHERGHAKAYLSGTMRRSQSLRSSYASNGTKPSFCATLSSGQYALQQQNDQHSYNVELVILLIYTKCHSYSSVRPSQFANRVINVWNTFPSHHTDFSSFAAFKRTVQQIDVFIMLLGLVLLGYCQCHLWPYNPVHTYVYMSMQLLLCVSFYV